VRYLLSLRRFAKKAGGNQIHRALVEVEQIMEGQFQADLLSKWSLTGRFTCSFDRTVLQKRNLSYIDERVPNTTCGSTIRIQPNTPEDGRIDARNM
jgi:hypothetical protein